MKKYLKEVEKMKKKIIAIEAVALILGTILISSINAQNTEEDNTYSSKFERLGNPTEIITFIRGKYTSIEKTDGWLTFSCKKGDIIFSGFRVEDSSLNMFNYYHINHATNIRMRDHPNFIGYCKDGRIFGIALGDIIYNENNVEANIKQNIEQEKLGGAIDAFGICVIIGRYETKTSNQKYPIILKTLNHERTISVSGVASVYHGDIPHIEICKIKVFYIEIEEFSGICRSGFVFGIGGNVRVIPNLIPL